MSATQAVANTPDMLCPNCGFALNGPYCASCGQKVPHPDLTTRELVAETTQELTSWDGKIPRTIKALFTDPGRLTLDFLAGRRARWLPPLRVYLICSLAFFLAQPLAARFKPRESGGFAVSVKGKNGGELTAEDRAEISRSLPARIFGTERLLRAAQNRTALNTTISASYPKAMFVLLPLFALLTRVAWRKRQPRYPAHLYNALHLHAAWFATLAVSTLLVTIPSQSFALVVTVAVVAYLVWYTLSALRRVFGERWPRTIGKAIGVFAAYAVCLFLVSAAMLAIALFTM